MLKVLGLSGTPRKDGNSDQLLQYALQPFHDAGAELQLIRLSELSVQPCRACEVCQQGRPCVIDDDMHRIYAGFRWCDALLVASPVYYRNINAHLMAVLERHYAILPEKALTGKVGGAIAVGRGAGQAKTLSALYTWMLSCGIICVPGELNGVTATASMPRDIMEQPDKLQQAVLLGQNVLHVTKQLYHSHQDKAAG